MSTRDNILKICQTFIIMLRYFYCKSCLFQKYYILLSIMKNYELLYIVSSNITPREVKTIFGEVNSAILELNGKILETPQGHPFLRADAQGQNKEEEQSLTDLPITKKRLAYPVEKNKNGYYILNNFGLEADKIAELDKKIKLVKNVLRYLIIKAEPMDREEIKRLKRLAEKRRKEKDSKREKIENKKPKSLVSKRAPEKIKKVEEGKEEIKKSSEAEIEPAVKIEKEKTKTEKESDKKKRKAKKIKLDDLEKKLDKILDETII